MLIGNLGRDPEVRFTPDGSPVASFSIATSETWTDKSGTRQERTEWHNIVAWNKLADLAKRYLAKGRPVYVEGRIRTREWDDRDGNKRRTTEIIASQMVAMAMANEKENKTLETLLSSPVNRKTIVFAKLIGAGTVALLSAGFYMIGFRSYINGITGTMAKNPASGQVTQILKDLGIVFGPVEYILLGASLFLGILVALAMAMILGSMTESSKNIQSIITPLMLLVLIPYFLTLFLDINAISPIARFALYIIPFMHTFLSVQKLMAHDYLFVIFGIIYQLIVFIIFVALAAKIFSSDKILTLKFSFKRKKKLQAN